MDRKEYFGLEAEYISFDDSELTSATVWHYSGCRTGSVAYYTEDASGNPMPVGSCWYDGDTDNLELDWASYSGGVSP